MNIFKLVGSVYVDTDKAEKDLKNTDKKASTLGETFKNGAKTVAKWGAAVGAAAGAAGAALLATANKAAENLDEIQKESQKLDLSYEAYQKLAYAAERSGMEIGDLSVGIKNITNDMADAANGVEGATDTFDALGVSIYNTDGSLRSNEEVLMDTLGALADMEDTTQRNALANEMFGRSYQDLAPLLNEGSEGIDALMQSAEDLGMVMSDDAVEAGAAYQDAMTDLKGSFSALTTELGVAVMPIIKGLAEWITANMPAIKETIGNAMAGIKTVINVVSDVVTALWSRFEKHLPAIQAVVETVFNSIAKFWKEHLQPCFDAIMTVVAKIAGVFKKYFENVVLPVFKVVFDTIMGHWNNTIKPFFTAIIDFITGVFSGNWKKAWQGIVDMFGAVFGGILETAKIPINAVIDAINSVFASIGSITVPDWVPGIGGTSFSLPQIPRLAQGGEIGNEGSAIVGEDGAELIELPRGARVTPLNDNNNAFVELGKKLDKMIELLSNSGKVYLDREEVGKVLAPVVSREITWEV